MTEPEWLASDDPQRMLVWIGQPYPHPIRGVSGRQDYCIKVTDRKLRLFACACCVMRGKGQRRHGALLGAIDRAERHADDPGVRLHHQPGILSYGVEHPEAIEAARFCGHIDAPRDTWRENAHLLRDIIGNPFEPVNLPRSWLTPTVLSLAQAAYEERVFHWRECPQCEGHSVGKLLGCPTCKNHVRGVRGEDGTLDPVRLAILADALEEAGCDNDDLLRHLRWRPCRFCGGRPHAVPFGHLLPCQMPNCMGAGGPHVRGCWALDLLLGKS